MKITPCSFLFRFIAILLMALTFSSCGVLTTTRYGNGLKLNLNFNGANGADSAYLKRYISNEKNYSVTKKKKPEGSDDINPKTTLFQESAPITDYKNLVKYYISDKDDHTVLRIEHAKNTALLKSDTSKPVSGRKDVPRVEVEPHAKLAGYLFYGSFIGYFASLATSLAGVAVITEVLAILLLLFGTLMLVAFILAIIALAKIREERLYNNRPLKGKGIAISVIVLYSVSLIFALLSILAYLYILLYILSLLF